MKTVLPQVVIQNIDILGHRVKVTSQMFVAVPGFAMG